MMSDRLRAMLPKPAEDVVKCWYNRPRHLQWGNFQISLSEHCTLGDPCKQLNFIGKLDWPLSCTVRVSSLVKPQTFLSLKYLYVFYFQHWWIPTFTEMQLLPPRLGAKAETLKTQKRRQHAIIAMSPTGAIYLASNCMVRQWTLRSSLETSQDSLGLLSVSCFSVQKW